MKKGRKAIRTIAFPKPMDDWIKELRMERSRKTIPYSRKDATRTRRRPKTREGTVVFQSLV